MALTQEEGRVIEEAQQTLDDCQNALEVFAYQPNEANKASARNAVVEARAKLGVLIGVGPAQQQAGGTTATPSPLDSMYPSMRKG
jgi:hypothetical protein